MKNKIGLIIIILLLTISSLAWTSANFEITPDINTLVPENALMYFQISDPEKLMSSTDRFLAATGMNEFIGNMKLQDFISVMLMSKNENLSIEYLNLSNPIGFAVIPGEDKYTENKDVDFILFLPINTSMNVLDLVNSQGAGDDFWYKIFMNYLIFFSSEDLKKQFPTNNLTNLSHMNIYNDDSLSIFLDINGIKNHFDIDISKLAEELDNKNSTELDLTTRMIEGYFYLFSQMEALFSNITLNRKGITFQSDLLFGGELELVINSFQDVNDVKKWSSYLPAEGFIQSIYSMNSEDQKNILKCTLDYLFPDKENNPLMSELKRTIGMFSDYTGNGGAFSIDLTKNSSTIPFGITMSMVSDLTDPEGYLQGLNSIIDSLYEDLDFPFQIYVEEININKNSPAFRITYKLQNRKTKSANTYNEMEELKDFLDNMEFWYYFSDEKVYSYIGPKGIEGIKELILANSFEKDWVNSAPDNAILIWNLSLSNMLKSLGNTKGLEMLHLLQDISFGLSGFSSFEDGILRSSAHLPAKDIMSIFQVIMELEF